MDKKMKIILIVLAICIIIVVILLFFLRNEQNGGGFTIGRERSIESTEEYVTYYDKLTKIEEKYEFFDVQNCASIYIDTLKLYFI